MTHKPSFMSHVLLSHLSQANNNPQVVADLFKPHQDNAEVIIASRHRETPVYQINATEPVVEPV